MDLTLGEIEKAAGGTLVLRGDAKRDTCVMSAVLDSRKAEAGCMFFATIGERVDGHRFIADVFAKGAVLAVTQEKPEQVEERYGCKASEWGSYLLVEDTLQALKSIAEAYRRKLSVKVVGVTGSVGKTSTKEFIAGVLAEKYKVLKTEGNFNNEIGVPLTLLRIRPEHEAAVIEMGISDFGEMHRLSEMARPDICVMTNIGQCHLENLKDRDGILRAKSEIFDFMAEDGEICLNGGDDKLSALTDIKGHKPHFFGLGENPGEEVSAVSIESKGLWGSDAMLVLRNVKAREKGTGKNLREDEAPKCGEAEAQVCHTGGSREDAEGDSSVRIPVHVPLPGVHMVRNAAAAACVGRLLGLSPEEIASGVSKVVPVSGRNNLIKLERYTLIDDCYNANPASMKAAIDLLSMADTKKTAILGDMFELGENSHRLHAEIGEYAAKAGLEQLFCVGGEARHMYEAAQKVGGVQKLRYFSTRDELLKALEQGTADIPKGSTILIKASHGMEFTKVLEFLKDYAS